MMKKTVDELLKSMPDCELKERFKALLIRKQQLEITVHSPSASMLSIRNNPVSSPSTKSLQQNNPSTYISPK